MKIGIITFHIAHNYGAFLQAYALFKVLKNKGHNVDIIDYRPKYLCERDSVFKIRKFTSDESFLSNIMKTIGSMIIQIIKYPTNKKCTKIFEDAQNKYLPMSLNICYTVADLRKNNVNYDLYVAGSDQIWNPKLTGGTLDPAYFLTWVDNKKAIKCSYAASCEINDEISNNIFVFNEYIANLDFISLRESSFVQFVKKRTNKEVISVLDPTLLLSKREWNEFSLEPSSHPKKFLLVYSLMGNLGVVKEAEKIAKYLGLDIVYLSLKKIYLKYLGIYKYVSLNEFIWYFAHSSFVVTNSFHGTVFSIIFEKPFYSIITENIKNRQVDFLSSLGLEDRIKKSIDSLDDVSMILDYTSVNTKLALMRKKSLDFLDRVCNNKS